MTESQNPPSLARSLFQRVAIARARLDDPAVIVLDEAASASSGATPNC